MIIMNIRVKNYLRPIVKKSDIVKIKKSESVLPTLF